jgi:uncharacterized protein YhaN
MAKVSRETSKQNAAASINTGFAAHSVRQNALRFSKPENVIHHAFIFKRRKIMENKITITLAILLLLITIFSTVFYFGRLKVSFIEWLFFYPCAVSNIVFLIGLTTSLFAGNKTWFISILVANYKPIFGY